MALPVEVTVKQFRAKSELFNPAAPCGDGGMALPHLSDDYMSAQIRPLVCWCNPTYDATWKDIELSLADTPVQSELGCLDGLDEVDELQNPLVNLSLKKEGRGG